MGKLVFLDLVDRSGPHPAALPARSARARSTSISATSSASTGSPAKSRRGEPSLVVDELQLLSRIRTPLPDTFHGLTDVEARYRRRYLDLLMNEETRARLPDRARGWSSEIRRYLDGQGFVEVETPVLQPRYGGAFARPFDTHHNELDQDLYLRIATELYLKRLIVGGLEKVYEIGRVFRNEGVSYKHNPEFTMLEWYEAYADYRDTMARFEELIETVALATIGTTRVTLPRQRDRPEARRGSASSSPTRSPSTASGRRTSASCAASSRAAASTRRRTGRGRSSSTTR